MLMEPVKNSKILSSYQTNSHVTCQKMFKFDELPSNRSGMYWSKRTHALGSLLHLVDDLVYNKNEQGDTMKDILERFIVYVPHVRHVAKSSIKASLDEQGAIRLRVPHPRVSLHSYRNHFISDVTDSLNKTSDIMTNERTSNQLSLINKIDCLMSTQFPEKRLIQYDCGKLQTLSNLLRQLFSNGHRVLLFTQMTRMLDILENFLNYHGYKYLRLDGSTSIEQRQCLMERFNNDKRIFCFILSTRSGGIGINLTGADTVIFYDSDWNPTMDAQAQDRCHRIGQTRDVHIYRLISEKTVEENILKKANQKRLLADMTIEGGFFTTALLKKHHITELFEEETPNETQTSLSLSVTVPTLIENNEDKLSKRVVSPNLSNKTMSPKLSSPANSDNSTVKRRNTEFEEVFNIFLLYNIIN
jgi:hypothetical protein